MARIHNGGSNLVHGLTASYDVILVRRLNFAIHNGGLLLVRGSNLPNDVKKVVSSGGWVKLWTKFSPLIPTNQLRARHLFSSPPQGLPLFC